MQRALPIVLALPLAALLAGPLSARPTSPSPVQGDDLENIIASQVQTVESLAVSDLWQEAEVIAALIGDEHGANFDAALDRRLAAGNLSGKGTLFLVAARLLGEEVDHEALADALLPLLGNADAEIAAASADVFASSGFDRSDEDLRERIADELIKLAEDGNRPAPLRARGALAAHQVGLGSQVSRPQRVLYGLLESQDPTLRAQGALALAQLGVIEELPGVESELERMATLPGEQGRLAAAYLKQVQLRRYHERVLTRARDEQSSMVAGGNIGSDLERVERLIDFVQRYHLEGDKVTRQELLEAAMNGMLQSLDRHSSFFPSDAYKRFEQDLEAEYGGIGAYVNNDPDDGLFTITRPIYSGPAYEAGLATDDKIIRIGEWPTVGETTDEVIKRLKGKPGTDVELYIWRRGMDLALIDRPTEDMKVVIERASITIPPVHYEMLPGNIGLIELTTFSRVASIELAKGLQDLIVDRGAKAIVLDLRNNTGGLLQEAQNVANLFLPPGEVVVRTESRVRGTRPWKTSFEPIVPADLPVVVLINRFSASAAEIVSGALQDHGRATLVGQRSYGKGSVQNLFPMPDEVDDTYSDENNNRRHDDWEPLIKDHNGNGEFDYAPRVKLTIERYLLPTGRSIHREIDEEGNVTSPGGVAPDEEVRPRRYEQWRLAEMRRIQDTRKLRAYAREQMALNPELMTQLAQGDDDDWTRYPGFEELYNDLGTILSHGEVRFLTRLEVRRAVQDARGSAFPDGDYQEDVQLQQAIVQLLEMLGQDIAAIRPYATTFDPLGDDSLDTPPAVVARAEELSQALALISAAEADGSLSKERLSELRELIERLKN